MKKDEGIYRDMRGRDSIKIEEGRFAREKEEMRLRDMRRRESMKKEEGRYVREKDYEERGGEI
jgi:hypothetical protein